MPSNQEQLAAEADSLSALQIISGELAKIADEIEDIPFATGGEISQERMIGMQRVDFCSQRLRDLSALMQLVNEELNEQPEGLFERLSDRAQLEHVRDLFAGWVEY